MLLFTIKKNLALCASQCDKIQKTDGKYWLFLYTAYHLKCVQSAF